MTKKILIAGDSFASKHLSGQFGWVKQLDDRYLVTNLAHPGIGEYKIKNQVQSVDVNNYDWVIVSHTSPYRVHTVLNPLYAHGHTYRNSDVILADAEHKQHTHLAANQMMYYFKFLFDEEYYRYIHYKCCQDIDFHTKNTQVIHITHFDWSGLYEFNNMINFYDHWKDNVGNFNHYTEYGNSVVFNTLCNIME